MKITIKEARQILNDYSLSNNEIGEILEFVNDIAEEIVYDLFENNKKINIEIIEIISIIKSLIFDKII